MISLGFILRYGIVPYEASPFQWFLEKLGHEGLNNLLVAYPDKSAYAQCIFSFCEGPDSKSTKLFVGRCYGRIVPARGPNAFG